MENKNMKTYVKELSLMTGGIALFFVAGPFIIGQGKAFWIATGALSCLLLINWLIFFLFYFLERQATKK